MANTAVHLTQAEFDALIRLYDMLEIQYYTRAGMRWKYRTDTDWLMGETVLRGKVGIKWNKIVIKENA